MLIKVKNKLRNKGRTFFNITTEVQPQPNKGSRIFTLLKRMIIAISIIILFFSCSRILNVSSVGKGAECFSLGEFGHLRIDGKYLFDTGASVSVFISNDSLNLISKETLFFQSIKDVHGKNRYERYSYFNLFPINNIHFHKAYMLKMNSEGLSESMLNIMQKGIIGMNIINKANWIINFKDSIIECIPKDSLISIPAENKIKLSYKNKVHPKVTLTINGITFKNMLFDTGAFDELSLTKSQISQIEEIELYGSIGMSGLYSKQTSNVYICKELNLNNVLFRDVLITETTKFPLIGMGIIKQFNHLFIDTKNQVFYLYN